MTVLVVVAAATTPSMPTVTLALELHILVPCYDMSSNWKKGCAEEQRRETSKGAMAMTMAQ